jgi:hypothetical protein
MALTQTEALTMQARITEVAPADRAKVVNLVCLEIDRARERITSEASWDRLAQFFYEAMLGRHTLAAATVLSWADAGLRRAPGHCGRAR